VLSVCANSDFTVSSSTCKQPRIYSLITTLLLLSFCTQLLLTPCVYICSLIPQLHLSSASITNIYTNTMPPKKDAAAGETILVDFTDKETKLLAAAFVSSTAPDKVSQLVYERLRSAKTFHRQPRSQRSSFLISCTHILKVHAMYYIDKVSNTIWYIPLG
jgi:hypothetical protein